MPCSRRSPSRGLPLVLRRMYSAGLSRIMLLPGRAALAGDIAGTRPPVDESPGISGILQDPRHRRYRCSRPPQVALPVRAREIKAALVQDTHDLGDSADFQEGLEHKPKPLLHLDIGILGDD